MKTCFVAQLLFYEMLAPVKYDLHPYHKKNSKTFSAGRVVTVSLYKMQLYQNLLVLNLYCAVLKVGMVFF